MKVPGEMSQFVINLIQDRINSNRRPRISFKLNPIVSHSGRGMDGRNKKLLRWRFSLCSERRGALLSTHSLWQFVNRNALTVSLALSHMRMLYTHFIPIHSL